MRVLTALGGNALLKRGEPLTAANQRANIAIAAERIARISGENEVVVAHGNGPQVGLLALQAAAYTDVEAYPLDVLGAESEAMIGYMLEQELGNVMPPEQHLVTVLTMTEVDPEDPAFEHPTKFIGPVYDEDAANRLAEEKGWAIAPDGPYFRRVVASPLPVRVIEEEPIKLLVESGTLVICAGGGGIPTVLGSDGILRGIEAVIDKDLAAAMLAAHLDADVLVIATDVEGVYRNWGTGAQELIPQLTLAEAEGSEFAAGSMGPKVQAACNFVRETGRRAVIGALADIEGLVAGTAGTSVVAG
ncbi:carbamate kinase [Brevibacterium sp. 5221]|uniref:Carbamate kinase n=1 Tax=Brevibacterium rongguiense TaxID=2695267 RepID=A0A6N9H7L1_9MICO|nr:carbamate kinase [Brevibacterium rongguiense]MYM19564.1 carbamate kinase [Brevibacterium rongguiense]